MQFADDLNSDCERPSVAILAQVAILLKVTVKQSQTCRSPARFGHTLVLHLDRSSVSLMDSVRLSQQTTQQTSFLPLPNQSQCTPADVPVPDITVDSRPSPISLFWQC